MYIRYVLWHFFVKRIDIKPNLKNGLHHVFFIKMGVIKRNKRKRCVLFNNFSLQKERAKRVIFVCFF